MTTAAPEISAFELNNQAVKMLNEQQYEAAAAYARAATFAAPLRKEPWVTLSAALDYTYGHEEEQIAAATKALRIDRHEAKAWHNLSLALMRSYCWEDALAASVLASREQPSLEYDMQQATLYNLLGLTDKANALYDVRLPELTGPQFRAINAARAINSARQGDWLSCFKGLASSHQDDGFWRPGQPLYGNVRIFANQGFGDQVQFSRMINSLTEDFKIGQIELVCSKPLHGLLGNSFANLTPVEAPTNVDAINVAIQDISWMLYMRGKPIFGSSAPHLLRTKFPPKSGRKIVTFSWCGNPKFSLNWLRRVPVKKFGQWAKSVESEYEFHSVQYGAAEGNAVWQNWPSDVPVVAHSFADFQELSELISGSHVFVGQCGSPLHIAGGLGVPAIGLFASHYDWRWDATSPQPLYDSVTSLVQARPGDWNTVFTNLHEAIQRVTI